MTLLDGGDAQVIATAGTAAVLHDAGVTDVKAVLKVHEGRPNVGDLVKNGKVQMMIISTTSGDPNDRKDGRNLRRLGVALKVPLVTTVAGARATAGALRAMKAGALEAGSLQEYFADERKKIVDWI